MNLLASFGGGLRDSKVRLAAAWSISALALGGLPERALAADPVAVGANVTFIATADGYPTPTFQWRKNGSNIIGATNATFVILAVSLTDAATYQVVATNQA